MSKPVDVDEAMIKEARHVARRVSRACRGLVNADDLQGDALVWAVKNRDKVEQWLNEGKVGRAKLNTALYRACQRAVSKERTRTTGALPGDSYYYTPEVLKDLLPETYTYDGWDYSSPAPRDGKITHTKAPSEGNNWLAMLVDVKWAVAGLPPDDQEVLALTFRDGMSARQAGEFLDVTDDTVRNRVDRALDRLSDRLGGLPPWWAGGRRAKSNAQAQSETRSNES